MNGSERGSKNYVNSLKKRGEEIGTERGMVYSGVAKGAERGLKKGDKRWKRVIKGGAEGLKRTVIVLEKVKEEK